MPAGSVGPLCARYLHKLRNHPAISALINTEPAAAEQQPHRYRQAVVQP